MATTFTDMGHLATPPLLPSPDLSAATCRSAAPAAPLTVVPRETSMAAGVCCNGWLCLGPVPTECHCKHLKVVRDLDGIAFCHWDERHHVHRARRSVPLANSKHVTSTVAADREVLWQELLNAVAPIVGNYFFRRAELNGPGLDAECAFTAVAVAQECQVRVW